MLQIKGMQKTTLIDFPPHVASTIFLGGCNWRCSYCHNPELVLGADDGKTMQEGEVLEALKERRGFIEGVCITGGEPTVHKELPGFIKKVKGIGLKVKLDTNGSNPEMIQALIDEGIIDYVAMDIKAAPEDYERAVGAKPEMGKIEETIRLLMGSGIDYEFRTTVFPGLFDEEKIRRIGEWLKGAKRFVLQQFSNENLMIDKSLKSRKPIAPEKIEELKRIAEEYFGKVSVRGI